MSLSGCASPLDVLGGSATPSFHGPLSGMRPGDLSPSSLWNDRAATSVQRQQGKDASAPRALSIHLRAPVSLGCELAE